MLSRTGYRRPSSKPAGRISHASTSDPSAETAVKRSGSESSTDDLKAEPTSLSCFSPEKTSGGEAGGVAVCNARAPAPSKPVSHTSPASTGSGSAEPSAGTRYGTLLPASSSTNRSDPPAQTGSRTGGAGGPVAPGEGVPMGGGPGAAGA